METNSPYIFKFSSVSSLDASLSHSTLAPYFSNQIKKEGLFAITQRMEIIKQARGNYLPFFKYNKVEPWPFNLADPLVIMAHMMANTLPNNMQIDDNAIGYFLRYTEIYLTNYPNQLRFLKHYNHNGYPIFIENADLLSLDYMDCHQYIKDIIDDLEPKGR